MAVKNGSAVDEDAHAIIQEGGTASCRRSEKALRAYVAASYVLSWIVQGGEWAWYLPLFFRTISRPCPSSLSPRHVNSLLVRPYLD